MMGTRAVALGFNALLLAASIWAVTATFSWRREVALFPLIMAGLATALAGIEMVWSLARPRRPATRAMDTPDLEDDTPDASTWAGPGWVAAFMVIVYLVGIPIGLPLMLLLMLRLWFKEGWLVSLASVGIVMVILLYVFGQLFGVIWPDPLVLKWLR